MEKFFGANKTIFLFLLIIVKFVLSDALKAQNSTNQQLTIKPSIDSHHLDFIRTLLALDINMGNYEKASKILVQHFDNSTEIERIINMVFSNNSLTKKSHLTSVLKVSENIGISVHGSEGLSLVQLMFESLYQPGRFPENQIIQNSVMLMKRVQNILKCTLCTCASKIRAQRLYDIVEKYFIDFGIKEIVRRDSKKHSEVDWFATIHQNLENVAEKLIKNTVAWFKKNIYREIGHLNHFDDIIGKMLLHKYYFYDILGKNRNLLYFHAFTYSQYLKNLLNTVDHTQKPHAILEKYWKKLIRQLKRIVYYLPECVRNLVFAKSFTLDSSTNLEPWRFYKTNMARPFVYHNFEIVSTYNGNIMTGSVSTDRSKSKCLIRIFEEAKEDFHRFKQFNEIFDLNW